jgi:hypothetical protein
MKDSSTKFIKPSTKDAKIFDIVEFGSTNRVSVFCNIIQNDKTGYISLVDKSDTPKTEPKRYRRKTIT